MRRASLVLALTVTLSGAALAGDLKIKVPEGMKAVSRQEGDTLEISFVPARESEEPRSVPVQPDVDANGLALPVDYADPQTTIALLSAETAAASSGPSPTANANASAAPAGNSAAGDILSKAISSLNFDRPLNAAPAFVALGVTPETVSHPTTPREFAASLLNGVDRKGTLQTGFALEAAPYQVFFGPQTTLANYQQSFLTRLLYNTNLSLATTKASTNDDKAQRVAFGMEFTLFDKGDPRMDSEFSDLFHGVTKKIPPLVRDPDWSDEKIGRASCRERVSIDV